MPTETLTLFAASETGGWSQWSPRAQIAPAFAVEDGAGRHGDRALALSGNGNPAVFGEWRKQIPVKPGQAYRLVAYYRTRDVPHPRHDVAVRLWWLGADGKELHWKFEHGEMTRQPDYALDVAREGDWTKVEQYAIAPEGAGRLQVMLGLRWRAAGKVWFDDVCLEPVAEVPKRRVALAAVHYRPRNTKSPAESVEQFCQVIEKNAQGPMDIICLPEGASLIGTGKTYLEVAEEIPGPTTRRLGDLARKLNCYLVVGIYEREGEVIYNTAVLIGRNGQVAGKFRKMHLPMGEADAGLTPGDGYPVFQTDFGTIGIMVCWDLQFPEPARALALAGAEVILLPIWGGNEILAKARAIENHAFLVSSTFDMKTWIVDPTGKVLAEGSKEQPLIRVEVDLGQPLIQPWLGDMRTCTWKERRPDQT